MLRALAPFILGVLLIYSVWLWLGALAGAVRLHRALWFSVILVAPFFAVPAWYWSGMAAEARRARLAERASTRR